MTFWRRMKIIAAAAVGLCVIALSALTGLSMIQDNFISDLVRCAGDESYAVPNPFSIHWPWGCEHVAYNFRLDPDEVASINSHIGAWYPVYFIPDKANADRMLGFFVSKGVDINATTDSPVGWTALHLIVQSDDLTADKRLQAVQLLLAHGAKPETLDRKGHTALYLAKAIQEKHPDRDYSQVIKLLETVTPPNIEAPPVQ
jgi:hypothetical protein